MEGRSSFWSEIWRAILKSKKHLIPNAIRKNIVQRGQKSLHWKHFTETGCGAMKTGQSVFSLLLELTEGMVATLPWIATHPPKLCISTPKLRGPSQPQRLFPLPAALAGDKRAATNTSTLIGQRLLKAQTNENFISFPIIPLMLAVWCMLPLVPKSQGKVVHWWDSQVTTLACGM